MEGKEEKEWLDKKQSVQTAINQMSKVINDIAAKHQTSISQLSKKYVSCSPHLTSPPAPWARWASR
jgi:hypothetical protein